MFNFIFSPHASSKNSQIALILAIFLTRLKENIGLNYRNLFLQHSLGIVPAICSKQFARWHA